MQPETTTTLVKKKKCHLIAAKCWQSVSALLFPFHHLTQPGGSTFPFLQDTGAGLVSLFQFVIQVSSYLVTQNDAPHLLSFLPQLMG